MKKPEPYTSADGEVRELDDHFFETAKRGRPALPDDQKRKRVNISLEPDLAAKVKETKFNLSQRVNEMLRKEFGL